MNDDDSTHTSTWPGIRNDEPIQMPWVNVKDTSRNGSGAPGEPGEGPRSVEAPGSPGPDELHEIKACVLALNSLPEDAAMRVVMYLHDRYVASVRDTWR